MSGRLQVALLLAALFGGYALIGMVDADEAVRGADARVHTEQRRAVCGRSEAK